MYINPNVLLVLGYKVIYAFEAQNNYLTWNNVWESLNGETTFGALLFHLILENIIFMIFGRYWGLINKLSKNKYRVSLLQQFQKTLKSIT